MTIYNQNKIVAFLTQYQIDFEIDNIVKLMPDQDLSIIPSKKIVQMLGLKQDEGHRVFIKKLNLIESNWLLIFLKYESYYDIYNNDGEVIKHNFYPLIYEILDGLL